MNITRTTEPRTYCPVPADGQPVTYSDVPTTTYAGINDADEEVATITVLDPTGEIIDATCLGSLLLGGNCSPVNLIDLVKAVAEGRSLCAAEPAYDHPPLLNTIATHKDLVDSVDLMTDEGLEAENSAALASYRTA